MAALAGPNTYMLTLPRRFKCSPTVNVVRLNPFYSHADRPDPPGPVGDPGQEGEHIVEQLLNCTTRRCRTYYLVRWQGHASAEDSWEPVKHLAHCPERVAKYEAAAPRRPRARWAQQRGLGLSPLAAQPLPAPAPPAPPPPAPPPVWAVAAQAGPLGRDAAILYWWPDKGWQLARVRRLSRTDPFTHRVTSSGTGPRPRPSRATSTLSWMPPRMARAGLRSPPVVLKSDSERYYRQSLQYGPGPPGRATADLI
jgi:hypothetical protein